MGKERRETKKERRFRKSDIYRKGTERDSWVLKGERKTERERNR